MNREKESITVKHMSKIVEDFGRERYWDKLSWLAPLEGQSVYLVYQAGLNLAHGINIIRRLAS